MKYLITGGSGFIGSNFIEYILADDKTKRVYNIDKLTYAADKTFAPKDERYTFTPYDIADIHDLNLVIRNHKFDVVVNFASHSHVDNSISNPELFWSNNISSYCRFLFTCQKMQQDGDIGKFIHISTDEVFGDTDVDHPFNETSLFKPSSPYSASKASQEMFIHSLRKMYGFKANIVRLCNNYGPRQYKEKLLPVVINAILKGKDIPVYGDGNQKREWIHVKESADIINQIACNVNDNEDYCIGSGNVKTNIEVIKMLNSLFNGNNHDNIKFVVDRIGHDKLYLTDSSKVDFAYPKRNKIQFEDGLKETFEFFKNKFDNIKLLVNINKNIIHAMSDNNSSHNGSTLMSAIEKATPVQVDTLWSILKYKEIGILRKVKCMSDVLHLDTNNVLDELPADQEGRLLDYKTRHMIHDTLIKVS